MPAGHRHDIYAHCTAVPPQSRRQGIRQHANPSIGRLSSKRTATSSPPWTLRSTQQNPADATRGSNPASRQYRYGPGRSKRPSRSTRSSIPAVSRQQHTRSSVLAEAPGSIIREEPGRSIRAARPHARQHQHRRLHRRRHTTKYRCQSRRGNDARAMPARTAAMRPSVRSLPLWWQIDPIPAVGGARFACFRTSRVLPCASVAAPAIVNPRSPTMYRIGLQQRITCAVKTPCAPCTPFARAPPHHAA